jgi:hypothetical protein
VNRAGLNTLLFLFCGSMLAVRCCTDDGSRARLPPVDVCDVKQHAVMALDALSIAARHISGALWRRLVWHARVAERSSSALRD